MNQSSLNGAVTCQVILVPAGKEAKSPGPRSTSLPSSNSIRTEPSRTWTDSRRSGVHEIGRPGDMIRVMPTQTSPSRTSSCISVAGTSGSGCHASVATLDSATSPLDDISDSPWSGGRPPSTDLSIALAADEEDRPGDQECEERHGDHRRVDDERRHRRRRHARLEAVDDVAHELHGVAQR